MTTPPKGSITHFDATQRRVEKMKQLAAGGAKASNGHHTPWATARREPMAIAARRPQWCATAMRRMHAAAACCAAARATVPPPRATAPVSPVPAIAPAQAPHAGGPVAAGGSGWRETVQLRLNPAELEKFLINFVVEQTGYPPEVVELDADLEADLGIDSIKKAQLFGELAEYFDVAAQREPDAGRFSHAAPRAELPGDARR